MINQYEAILFDMDGVLASVGMSYRESIIQTAAHFNVTITHEQITIEKKKGNSNNDWILTKRLIENNSSINVSIEEVTEVFENIYQGTDNKPGLCETELLIPSIGLIDEIYRRMNGKIAIVTGRPRKDCIKFLVNHKLDQYFNVCICMEDCPAKPSPIPVIRAAELLNVSTSKCLMLGDTPDDIRAAVSAGAYGYGVLTPEEHSKLILNQIEQSHSMIDVLLSVGAISVMKPGLSELLDIIPSLSISNLSSIKRFSEVKRQTKETSIHASVLLDGTGISKISTGLGFLDHMFSQLSKHGRFDIYLECKGDLHIDDHHTAEDCALALGEAFDKALGKREGITRFGLAVCPLDEALSRVVIDISSRPHSVIDLQLTREMIGSISSEMIIHVLQSFASTSRITLHVTNLYGVNNHHKVESAFKALGVAMRQAVSYDKTAGIPSTKGVLS